MTILHHLTDLLLLNVFLLIFILTHPLSNPSDWIRRDPPVLPARSCADPPAPLPPARARFRDALLCSSGALTCVKSRSVEPFLCVWQLLRRTQNRRRDRQDSRALSCMAAREGDGRGSMSRAETSQRARGDSFKDQSASGASPSGVSDWSLD